MSLDEGGLFLMINVDLVRRMKNQFFLLGLFMLLPALSLAQFFESDSLTYVIRSQGPFPRDYGAYYEGIKRVGGAQSELYRYTGYGARQFDYLAPANYFFVGLNVEENTIETVHVLGSDTVKHTLYNFGLEVGDTFRFPMSDRLKGQNDSAEFKFLVEYVGDTSFDGRRIRKYLRLEQLDNFYQDGFFDKLLWVEGIGTIPFGVNYNVQSQGERAYWLELLCNGDSVLYRRGSVTGPSDTCNGHSIVHVDEHPIRHDLTFSHDREQARFRINNTYRKSISIQLLDQMGRKILNESTDQSELSIGTSALKPGIYLVLVHSDMIEAVYWRFAK